VGKILIVDDDQQLLQSFEKLLSQEGHEVRGVSSGEQGVAAVKADLPDLVILDVRLPGMDGLATFEAIHEREARLPVIIMTAFGTTETAIQATKMGAFDYVLKPFNIPEMLNLIGQALEAGRFMRSPVALDGVPDVTTSEAMIGRSKTMQEVYKTIGRVAPTDATVLIRGESGTGKELAARAIYQHSLRVNKPFLVINCVAIPETLLESELFGYEKGAFTGAVSRRVGKMEQANGGTVFLDEIGDMPFSIQAKVLRLLQEKSIERLGGREPIPVDVRIIAATNRNLETALSEGRFREDLYYRLKVVTLWLPALRDRMDDVPLLASYFLSRLSAEMKMDNPGLTEQAQTVLFQHAWPGNVRELGNIMQKALILSRGGPIGPDDILPAIRPEPESGSSSEGQDDEALRTWIRAALGAENDQNLFNRLSDHFAGLLIGEALQLTNGNRTRAAKLLGLSRPTLLSKIEKYNLKLLTNVTS